MNQAEYILEESEKMLLTEKQLDCIIQSLITVEVDLVVYSKQELELHHMLQRITNSLRELRLSVSEQELQD